MRRAQRLIVLQPGGACRRRRQQRCRGASSRGAQRPGRSVLRHDEDGGGAGQRGVGEDAAQGGSIGKSWPSDRRAGRRSRQRRCRVLCGSWQRAGRQGGRPRIIRHSSSSPPSPLGALRLPPRSLVASGGGAQQDLRKRRKVLHPRKALCSRIDRSIDPHGPQEQESRRGSFQSPNFPPPPASLPPPSLLRQTLRPARSKVRVIFRRSTAARSAASASARRRRTSRRSASVIHGFPSSSK